MNNVQDIGGAGATGRHRGSDRPGVGEYARGAGGATESVIVRLPARGEPDSSAVTQLGCLPMSGFTVAVGDSPAEQLAARHLEYLGAVRSGAYPRDLTPSGSGIRLDPLPGLGHSVPSLHCHLADLPARSFGRAGHELLSQAAWGLMSVHGRKYGRPRRIPVDYVEAVTGVALTQSALALSFDALRGGTLSASTTSMARTALTTVGQYLAAATADSAGDDDPPAAMTTGAHPPFRTADGVWVELEALEVPPWISFWSELGASPAAASASWLPFMLRYANGRAQLAPELHQALAGIGYQQLTALAARTGMSVCRVRGIAQRRGDPGLMVDGRVAPPWRLAPFELSAPNATPAAGPQSGGSGPRAGTQRLPLRGVVVLEAGRRIQAPLATHLLRLLGATVVRLEPPGGDPLRWMAPHVGETSARFLALNRGKEVAGVDLKSVEGRARVLELAAGADVLLHNWAPGKDVEFGLSPRDLAQANPRLVYCHASGWGAEAGDGPGLGTDFMAQAHSGLADLMREDGPEPRPSLMTLLDVLGGFVAAEAVLAGLVARQRTGIGCEAGSSLLSASTLLQYKALEEPSRLSDHGCANGAKIVDPLFPTADGWLVLASEATTHLWRLCEVLGLEKREPQDADLMLAEARAALAELRTAEAVRLLAEARIPVAEVLDDLADLPHRSESARHIEDEGCAFVRSPWEFSS